MKITRRNFLAWAGLSAVGAVACEGFGIREGELKIQSPALLPEDLVRGRDNWYATLCRSCPSSEGIIVRVMEGRAKKIQGNPLYPVNMGKQSARCEAGLQAVYHPDRVAGPMRRSGPRGSGEFTAVDWESGLSTLRGALQERGEGLTMITEPLRGNLGMVAGRFATAFGGRHLGFEALDNITYRMAMKDLFQQDLLPDFDFEHTSVLLSFGADFLSTWLSPTRWSRGYGEFRQGEGRERGTLYHVDPRFSMTAANADLWLPIKPGWEGHLALSLAHVIISEGLQGPGVDVSELIDGGGASALDRFAPEAMAGQVFLPGSFTGQEAVDMIRNLAREFAAGGQGSLAIGGGSAGAQTNGLFNLEAIYALNYLVGSAVGEGRMNFNPGSPLPDMPATATVGSLQDWSDVTRSVRDGRTKLLLLHQADPVHGLPGAVALREALLQQEDLFIVSFSPFLDETSVMADLVLPDRVSLEDWGDDIPEPGPGYQVVGFQQPVINPLSDFDPQSFPNILLTMAQDLEKDAELSWAKFDDLLKERSEELRSLGRGSISAASASEFWNNLLQRGGWWDENETGSQTAKPPAGLYNRLAGQAREPEFSGFGESGGTFNLIPFSHNTLLEGQNSHLPWLQAAPDPLTTITWQTWVEINDGQAKDLGLREGDIVRLESSPGLSIRVPVYPSPAVPPGVVSVPLGQGRHAGSPYATDGDDRESSNVMSILEPSQVEGTGALAWANTRVRVLPTGDSIRVSKLEGQVRAVEIGITVAEQIIQTVRPDQH
ncbi:MAG: hypothetical protein BZY88_05880 [SAR202 cluster bacterium Io17-Chloro-G9]|nr:MAG: hypothetical protein BZY88_05880 [SAR202 cluster bacterium Io17-Chloro-G9]